ncbi:hypothetical protein EKO04_003063 [Ascochyta lentis]|uniref:Uncharacterized protein n=1 Tax=Ascochyta lentis TaxID=205686 RepID=A0A8H7J6D1_9PLEO|nr:hypothetical protein EKO04_003063 [Ascochyta lentis]
MPIDIDDDDDDYVAKLLAQDAKKSTKTYDLVGLDAFNPRRSRAGAPKPNTNFLRHIIRQTDSHNAALLAKEAEESSSRLREMNRGRDKERTEAVDRVKRKIEGRLSPPSYDEHPRPRHPTRRDDDARDKHIGIGGLTRGGMKTATKIEQHTSRKGQKITERMVVEIVMMVKEETKGLTTGIEEDESPLPDPSDSDPLEAIVGPLPPPSEPTIRSRGRGALKANSMGIESHFSSTYDPSIDVRPDSDIADDWSEALEVMRDRERWKQQGAERLRAAGFKDEQVKKWEKGGDPTEEDVVWSKKGQDREWDRGKIVDEDGDVELRPEWGRLK